MTPVRPLHDWRRHHPTAHRIADDMANFPDLCRLRTRALITSVRERYPVGTTTAERAVSFARDRWADAKARAAGS